MNFLGVLLIIIGAYLANSGYKNRPPWGTIVALIEDPSDVTGTLEKLEGTFTQPTVIRNSFQPSGGEQQPNAFTPGGGKNGQNGKLPDSELRSLSWAFGKRLRPDAAAQLEALNRAFKARFGSNLQVTDAYRSYSQQVAVKASKGNLAAPPGTSNHGWGIAVDLGSGINRFGTAQHKWMQQNAGRYGWKHPEWAQQGGSKPEPWHWEYGS